MKLVQQGLLAIALVLSYTGVVQAADAEVDKATVIITWKMPTTDCKGVAIPDGELIQLELFVSDKSIPGSGTQPCVGGDAALPNGLVAPLQVDLSKDSYEFKLPAGQHYARMRVRGKEGGWSTLSNQLSFTVVIRVRPNRVRISLGS